MGTRIQCLFLTEPAFCQEWRRRYKRVELQDYCRMAYNEVEKKKQGHEKTIKEKEARMYEEPGDDCPIRSLKFLLAKLHPDCKSLFQYPRSTVKLTDIVWFNRQPIDKNIICQLMKRINEAVELSRTYTNHCIRATSITVMNAAGIEGTNIISITGHKSVDSMKPYLNPVKNKNDKFSKQLHQAKYPILSLFLHNRG